MKGFTMKTTLLIIAFLTASAFCQTSQPASQPVKDEQVSEELQERIITEAKSDYENRIATLQVLIKNTKHQIASAKDGIRNIPRDIQVEKRRVSDSRNGLCPEDRASSRKKIPKLQKELRDQKQNIQDFSNSYNIASKELAELKKQIAGETYFRKIDKSNMTKGSCGQILDGKIKILEILSPERIVAEIAIEPYYPKGCTKPKYHTIKAEIGIAVGSRKVNDIIVSDKVYQITGVSSDEEKPQLALSEVKIIRLNISKTPKPYCRQI